MQTLNESLAEQYATATTAVLADEFPALRDNSLGRIVPEEIARQAESPMRSFEVIVTYTREWRLIPDGPGGRGWRVRLACFLDDPTPAEANRAQRINEALRAIRIEE